MKPEIFSAEKFKFKADALSKNALSIISRLQSKKFKAYIVGGGIRDLIEGLDPKDFDIVTDCEPREIRKLFRNSRIIGRRFKLVHITFPNEVIEVTTFRSGQDSQSDSIEINDKGRIIRDNKWGTQEEDVVRRDLTINSIYFDPLSDKIVDYTGGVKDLESKKIRFVGDAEKRIIEDPVRILRVIRFAAKLNFEIEPTIKKAITKHKNQLLDMSSARIYEEIIKMFLAGYALKTYQLLQEYDLFDLLFPHLENSKENFNEFYENAFKNTDQRLKENIVDAGSQWNDIKAVKVRNFNFIDDPNNTKMLGVVAQEIETVSAGLVKTENDITTDAVTGIGTVTGTTKVVKYSILYMKAVKALQEAMTRIETLETKVAALESA